VASNNQKTPLAQSLNRVADMRAADAVGMLGRGLPCTVLEVVSPGIVLVNFEVEPQPFALPQVKMPVSKHLTIQYPIKVGDIGVALSADLRTGALTGLGGGKARITDSVGTLAAMTFFWLGSLNEQALDADALCLNGNIAVTPDALGFFASSKVGQQSIAEEATDLGSCITLTNSIRAALIAYGLATGD
jgi:hypothetical protein